MKSDTYLRIVLTIIALCLLWLCVKDLATPASAQREAQRVFITGVERGSMLPVSIARIDVTDAPNLATSTIQSLPITITKVALDRPFTGAGEEKTIPITIKGIDMGLASFPNDRHSLPIRGQVSIAKESMRSARVAP